MEYWGTRVQEVGVISSAAKTLTKQDVKTQLYVKLPSDRHIRLISLASDTVSEQEILRCSFVEQGIREVIPWAGYNALSYVWGDSPERVTISCNGHMTFITRNLYNALQQIWKVTPKQVLWADALCINQDDDEEEGYQVSMMGDIYKTATTVLIWLGDDENTFARSWTVIGMAANEPGNIEDDSALDGFLAHPWFTRAWTLQEVLLARKAVLICGTRWIDWRLLFETIGPKGPLEALQKCIKIMQLEHGREEGQNPLKELLWASSMRYATDPRDKLYALLGLLTQTSTRIRPDYTIPYRQLVINFVIDQVRRHGDIWFLHACGTDREVNRQRNSLDLGGSHEEQRSWVPDLLNPLSLKLISERRYHNVPVVHGPGFQENVHQMGDGRLRVHGIAIGIFRRVGADESETCRIAPLPVCVVELMSKGNTGNVELSFEGSASTLKGHCPRYLGSIHVNLGFFYVQSEVRLASDLREYMARHLRQPRCLVNENLPFFQPGQWAEPGDSCPISPKSVHCKIKTGDFLCVLSNKDGLFVVRPLPRQMGSFRLVGSAFAPKQELANREPKVWCQWRIPSQILQFDLY